MPINCGTRDDAVDEEAWRQLLRGCFERLATARLPDFVRARYRFEVDGRGRPEFVRLNGGTRVGPLEMASGFRLWTELALTDAFDVVRAVAAEAAQVIHGDREWPHAQERSAAQWLLHMDTHHHDLQAAMDAAPEDTVARLSDIAHLLVEPTPPTATTRTSALLETVL